MHAHWQTGGGGRPSGPASREEDVRRWALSTAPAVTVHAGVAAIVGPAAKAQTALGLLSAGPVKAWHYAAEKVAKRFGVATAAARQPQ